MANFKTKRSRLRRIGFELKEGFKEGLSKAIQKEYDLFQYQTQPIFKIPEDGGLREFENKEDALAFGEKIRKTHPFVKHELDLPYFVGAPCDIPEVQHIVLYSKKPFEPEARIKFTPPLVKAKKFSPTPQCMGFDNFRDRWLSPAGKKAVRFEDMGFSTKKSEEVKGLTTPA